MPIKLAICCIYHNNHDELKRQLDSYLPYVYDKDVIDHFIYIDGIFNQCYYLHSADNIDLSNLNSDLSNDGSTELILEQFDKYGIRHKLSIGENPNLTDHQKRNKYLEVCNLLNVDAMIILDSDEYFDYSYAQKDITDYRKECWSDLKKSIENRIDINNMLSHNQKPIDRFSQLPISNNVYLFPFLNYDESTKQYIEQNKPRLWLNPGQMSYCYNSHYYYYNKKEEQSIKDYYDANKLKYCQPYHGFVQLQLYDTIRMKHDHLLKTSEKLEQSKLYHQYTLKYESLVQNGFSHEEAEELISNLSDELINKILNR